jgi:hypothetical protein
MSELSDTAEQVKRSLTEQPTLNTAALIAGGDIVGDDVDRDQIQAALDELVAAGIVKHRPTGWKLA